jgi:hypothetical protein
MHTSRRCAVCRDRTRQLTLAISTQIWLTSPAAKPGRPAITRNQTTSLTPQDALEAASQKEARALAKLRDVRARAASNAGPGALLAALAEETSLARYTAQERLPKVMEARRERLLAVQTVLNEPVSSEQDLAAMQVQEWRDLEVSGQSVACKLLIVY